MAFARKCIDVSFSLETGKFDGGGNTYTVKGLRVSAAIDVPGGNTNAMAAISIWGLPLSIMNALTVLPTDLTLIGRNTVTLLAYEEGGTPATVFQGTIHAAFADGRSQPQVSFHVQAIGGLYEQIAPAKPISVRGSADVAQTIQRVATDAGLVFENNGVDVKLQNPYVAGSAVNQIQRLAKAAGINHVIDRNTVSIWPRGQARKGDTIEVSPETGMRGYPAYTAGGIDVSVIFNPQIQYGCKIKVTSDFTPACGVWAVYNVAHDLECEMPNGRWFTTLSASRLST